MTIAKATSADSVRLKEIDINKGEKRGEKGKRASADLSFQFKKV